MYKYKLLNGNSYMQNGVKYFAVNGIIELPKKEKSRLLKEIKEKPAQIPVEKTKPKKGKK